MATDQFGRHINGRIGTTTLGAFSWDFSGVTTIWWCNDCGTSQDAVGPFLSHVEAQRSMQWHTINVHPDMVKVRNKRGRRNAKRQQEHGN